MTRVGRKWLGSVLVLATLALIALSGVRGLAQGGTLRYGDTVTGTLQPGGSDDWTFLGEADDLISLVATRVTGDMSLALVLTEGATQPLAASQAGVGAADVILGARLPRSTEYVIRVTGTGQTASEYRLGLALTSRVRNTPTAVPTVTTGGAVGTINYGETVRGELGDTVFRQGWRLQGNAGLVVDIVMQATSGDLDSSLLLLGPDGETLIANESINGGRDAGILGYQLPFTGEYLILARVGQSNTGGSYALTVNVRGSAPDAMASVLGFDAPIRGRVSREQPRAVYRLASSGTLAFNIALDGLHRLVNLRILTAAGVEVSRFSGLNPLLLLTIVPDGEAFFAEISATDFQDSALIDFEVSATRIFNAASVPKPLTYGVTRQSVLVPGALADEWVFAGQAGDLLHLRVEPDIAVAGDATTVAVVLVSPQTITLFEGALGAGLNESLNLPATGFYRLELRSAGEPTSLVLPYQIAVNRLGAAGLGFTALTPRDQGEITLGGTVRGSLPAGDMIAYWLDIAEPQPLSLVAQTTDTPLGFGVALLDPAGEVVAAQTGERFGQAAMRRVALSQPGRYRAVVFNRQATTAEFTLSAFVDSGGVLSNGKAVKGVMPPGAATAQWTMIINAGEVIHAQAINLTPSAWTPRLLIADPSRQIIATADMSGDRAQLLGLTAPLTGRYTVVLAGGTANAYAAYRLTIEARQAFAASPSPAITVASTTTTAAPLRFTPSQTSAPIRVDIPGLVSRPASYEALTQGRVTTITLGSTVRGDIAEGEVRQAFRFSSRANLTFHISAVPLGGGRNIDLLLYDNNGRLLAEGYPTAHNADPAFATTTMLYRTERGGQFTVVASMGLRPGRFLLTVAGETTAIEQVRVEDGRPLSVGQTVAGELREATAEDRYFFFGRTRDLIALRLLRTTGTFAPAIEIISPGGVPLTREQNVSRNAALALDGVQLVDNGLHTIVVRSTPGANGFTGGRYFLTLGLVEPLRLRNRGGGVLAAGVPQTGYLSLNNADDEWLFHGKVGELATLTLNGLADSTPTPLEVELRDTAGQLLTFAATTLARDTLRLSDFMLPATGLYRVQVRGGRTTAGLYGLTLRTRQNGSTFQIVSYGQSASGYFTSERRSEAWVFSGTAGDNVTLSLRALRGVPVQVGFQVFAENNLPLATAAPDPALDGVARVSIVLPFNGLYTIIAANLLPITDPTGAGVYAVSLALNDTKARSLGTTLHPGQIGRGDLYADDPSDTWLFRSAGGDRVKVTLRAVDSFLAPQLELRDLGGNLLASATGEGLATLAADGFELPADGVYSLAVSGGGGTTGAYELSLTNDRFTEPDIALEYGASQDGVLDSSRIQDVYRFSGSVGDRLQASITREPGANLAAVLTLQTLAGEVLAYGDAIDADTAAIRDFPLPASGEYQLVAGRYRGGDGRSAGRYTLTLNATPATPIAPIVLRYGQVALRRLNETLPEERFSIEGRAGDVITVVTEAKSGDVDLTARIETPLGVLLAANDDASGLNARLDGVLLPADGLYTIIVSRLGTGVGNYEVVVNRLYQPAAPTTDGGPTTPLPALLYGQRVLGSLDPATPESRYAFTGAQGDAITLRVLHEDDDAPLEVALTDPAGNVLATGRSANGQTEIVGYTLPSDGTYLVTLRRPGASRAAFSPFALTVDLAAILPAPAIGEPTNGGVLTANDAVIGAFEAGQTAHYWLFPADAGTGLELQVQPLTGDLAPRVVLVGPSGQGLTALTGTPGVSASASVTLSVDGIYSLVILPGGEGRSGQYRLVLQTGIVTTPTPRTITPGQTVSGTLTPTEPEQRWDFAGSAGQTVTAQLLATGETSTDGFQPRLQLLATNGAVLADGAAALTATGPLSAIIGFTLPASGSYQLVASAQAREQASGAYRLTLDAGNVAIAVPTAGPLAYNQPVQGVVQREATALWSIDGAKGDAVSVGVAISRTDGESLTARVELRTLDGRVLGHAQADGEIDLPAVVLPETGRYLIAIQPTATVGYSLAVQRRQDYLASAADRPLRAMPFDLPRAETILSTDGFDLWRFEATAGTPLSVTVERISGQLRADVTLFGPSGYLTSAVMGAGLRVVSTSPLRAPDSGAYTVVVTRWLGERGPTNGNYRLTLTQPPISMRGGQLAGYNVPVAGEVSSAQAEERWSFDGGAGTVVSVRVQPIPDADGVVADLSALEVALLDGAQSTMNATREVRDGAIWLRSAPLPINGSYTVSVKAATGTTIRYRLEIALEQSGNANAAALSLATAAGLEANTTRQGTLTTEQPVGVWVFVGKAGERITLEASAKPPLTDASPDFFLQLLAPDGRLLAADDGSGPDQQPRLANIFLLTDGFYAVSVSASQLAVPERRVGDYALTLVRGQPGALYLGTLTDGVTVRSSLMLDATLHEWQIVVEAADVPRTVTLTLAVPTPGAVGVLQLIAPDGQIVAESVPGETTTLTATLTEAGRYVVLVKPLVVNSTPVTFNYQLTRAVSLAATGGGSLFVGGPTVIGALSDADFSDQWRVTLTDLKPLVLTLTRTEGDLSLDLTVFGPDGTVLFSGPADGLTAPLQPTQPGPHTLVVTRAGGALGATVGSYALTVRNP